MLDRVSEVPSKGEFMSASFYQEYHETDHEEVVVYKRPDSPYYYSRMKNPSKKGRRYLTRSLKTKNVKEAKKLALPRVV